jgi:hypothetical protein
VIAYDETELSWRFNGKLNRYDVKDFALEDNYGDDKIPAKIIDWDDRDQYLSTEILIPADAIAWEDAEGPLVPVDCLDWRSQYTETASQVRIIDLDGPEEVVVVRRGTDFAAYKVKTPEPGSGTYARSY